MPIELSMYVVYERPKDYPDKYVVRRWLMRNGDLFADNDLLVIANTLNGARAEIPAGFVKLGPLQGDDPVIIETWI